MKQSHYWQSIVVLVCIFFLFSNVRTTFAINLENNSSDVRASLATLNESVAYGDSEIGFSVSNTLHKMDSSAALPLLGAIILLLFGSGLLYVFNDYQRTKKVVSTYYHPPTRVTHHMVPVQKR